MAGRAGMIEFNLFFDLPTKTHQQKKVTCAGGKPRFYEPPEVKAFRQELMWRMRPHAPEVPLTGPLKLNIVLRYPKIKRALEGQYKDTAPDADNAAKLPKDCLTQLGFWKDDAQVSQLQVVKIWSSRPGIYVRIDRLEE